MNKDAILTDIGSHIKAEEFLLQNLIRDAKNNYGCADMAVIQNIAKAWMNDAETSKDRFDTIKQFLPDARKILDMASGCGTAVFYGLLNGYDVYGVDPESWKNKFNSIKAKEYGYPEEWMSRFVSAYGEKLPFKDSCFDCVTSYQTLEHVQDVEKCILEMLRVTKTGGGIHIRCPDYRGTFEPHYKLPWLPLMNRKLAAIYLKIMRRSKNGLDNIQYVTKGRIISCLKKYEHQNEKVSLDIIDVARVNFNKRRIASKLNYIPGGYFLWRVFEYICNLFRKEQKVNLFVYLRERR